MHYENEDRVDGIVRTGTYLGSVLLATIVGVFLFVLFQQNLFAFVSTVVAILTIAIVAYTVSFMVMYDRMSDRGYQWGLGAGFFATSVGVASMALMYFGRKRFDRRKDD